MSVIVALPGKEQAGMARHSVSIERCPSSNRRRRLRTAPPCRNYDASFLVSCAGDHFLPSDGSRDGDPPAPRHSSLPTSEGVQPSRRDAVLRPVDLRILLMAVREPPGATRAVLLHVRKE